MAKPVRNVFCAWYPLCLNVHIRHHKRRFDCSRCARYRPIHIEAEEVIEEAIRCGEFLHAVFFGLPEEEEEMPKRSHETPSEFVSVPVDLLRGLIYSFYQGMEYIQSSFNITIKLEEVLKQREKRGQLIVDPEGDTGEGQPGAENQQLGV